jgi:hypothetical protein
MTDTAPAQTRTPNAKLAYAVLDHIDADPDSWDQGNWFEQARCGTTACFAGWTTLLSGDQPQFGSMNVTDLVVTNDARREFVAERAAELLRVEYDESHTSPGNRLFSPYHDRKSLGAAVADIFGPRPDPQS